MMTAGIIYILMCELGHFLLAFFSGMIAWLLMTVAYHWLYPEKKTISRVAAAARSPVRS